jgi:carbon-monoxide dehydrogenase large subunit
LAVLTGGDAGEDGLQPIPQRPVPANPHEVPLKSRHGSPFLIAPHPVLALGKTRYVGEPVAMVIAETFWQAIDAAERLAVEYAPLPAVVQSADALALGAPLVWNEHAKNLCVDSEAGDEAATELAFARAAHVVRLETAINRVTGVPMEFAGGGWRLRRGRGPIHGLYLGRRRRGPAARRHRRRARRAGCRGPCGRG